MILWNEKVVDELGIVELIVWKFFSYLQTILLSISNKLGGPANFNDCIDLRFVPRKNS